MNVSRTLKNTFRVAAVHNGKAHGSKKPQRPTNRPVAVPLGQFPASLEGLTPPRAILRLARGPSTPSGDSPPHSRPPRARDATPTPPTRALNALAYHGRPGQKANPHHAGLLTPPGNHIPALFCQPALCDHPWHCAGAVREGWCQFRDTMSPTPIRPPRRTPLKRTAKPMKKLRTPTLRPRWTTP
jgi:hypothetical protein